MELEVGPLVEDRGPSEPPQVVDARFRKVHVDGPLELIEREPCQYAGQAEAVVAVEVGDADGADRRARDACEQQLALRPLARIEEDRLVVPSQHVAVGVTIPRRHLCGCAEYNELALRHGARLLQLGRLVAMAGTRAGEPDPTRGPRSLAIGTFGPVASGRR